MTLLSIDCIVCMFYIQNSFLHLGIINASIEIQIHESLFVSKHYENLPMQDIFQKQKLKISLEKICFFFFFNILAQNILWVHIRTALARRF